MISGRARLTVCAAAASVMAACSLLPLTDGKTWIFQTWIFQALFLVAIQSSVGALARRLPLPRPLTVLTQATASFLLLTLMFARQQAFLGILPVPGALRHFGALMTAGVQDVSQFSIPAPVTSGIRLMLVGGVLLIALAVDALAVTYGSAAPAGLPLLALYSIAAGLSGGGGLTFLIAAAGYLLLLLAEGRDRLSRWGRVFAGPGDGRPASGYPGGSAPFGGYGGSVPTRIHTGHRIGAMALGIALVVAWALPSLSGGLLAATGARRGSGGGGSILAVNPLVALTDDLSKSENREVLVYRTNAEQTSQMYLRIVSLDEFNGEQWQSAKRSLSAVPAQLPNPQGLSPEVKTKQVDTNIAAAKGYGQLWLPLPYPAMRVDLGGGRWRYEPEGRSIIGDRGQTTSDVSYSVTSLQVEPTAAQLATAPSAPPSILREYTAVPDSLPAVVKQTARNITKNATSDYQKAVDLQDWFTNGQFTYSTSVSSGTGADAIAKFLKNKEGFCVHFAFTMAAMARTLGIPARVSVGFTPGTPQSNGSYIIKLKDAHAWPELYFEGIGWTRFEPTPTRGSPPDYTQDITSVSPGTSSPDVPSRDSSAAPSASASASPTCSAKQAQQGDCGLVPQISDSGPTSGGPWGWLLALAGSVWLAVLLLGVCSLVVPLMALTPFLPLLWRRRARARRLRAPGRAADRTTVSAAERVTDLAAGVGSRDGRRPPRAVLDAWRELVDTAWDYGVLPDDSETPRRAVARLIGTGRLDDSAAQAARRLAAAVEQALYAPRPRPAAGIAADVLRVHQSLRDSADRVTRLRATLAPRSAVRVWWALSERWAMATASWGAALRRGAEAVRRPARQAK